MKGGKIVCDHADDLNDGWHVRAPDKVVSMILDTFYGVRETRLIHVKYVAGISWINAGRFYKQHKRLTGTRWTSTVTEKDGRSENKRTTATRRPSTETEMVWWSGKADKKIDHQREHNMTGDTSGGAHADDLNDGWHANAPDKVINVTQETCMHEWEDSLVYANCADVCWSNADRSYTKYNRTIGTWRTTIVTGKDGRLVNKHTTVIGRYNEDWNLGGEGTLKNHRVQYKWEDTF
jgi:hypothetical protein